MHAGAGGLYLVTPGPTTDNDGVALDVALEPGHAQPASYHVHLAPRLRVHLPLSDGLLASASTGVRDSQGDRGCSANQSSRRLLEEPRLAILYIHRLARACGSWPRVLGLLVFAALRRTSGALVGEHCSCEFISSYGNLLATFQ